MAGELGSSAYQYLEVEQLNLHSPTKLPDFSPDFSPASEYYNNSFMLDKTSIQIKLFPDSGPRTCRWPIGYLHCVLVGAGCIHVMSVIFSRYIRPGFIFRTGRCTLVPSELVWVPDDLRLLLRSKRRDHLLMTIVCGNDQRFISQGNPLRKMV